MLGPPPPPPFDPGLLHLASDLRRLGTEPTRDEEWHRVRHGVFVRASVWAGLLPVQRHAALARATLLRGRSDTPPVLAAVSAAALWGLPRVEAWPTTVSVLTQSRRDSPSGLLRPVVGPPGEVVRHSGVSVTSVPRTLVDLARTASLASAVAAADHALRHGLCTRAELEAEVRGLAARTRGRRAAALVRDLADPLSMSAGESLSRVQMFLLDLPRPRLQVEQRDEAGLIGYTDFGWPGVAGEFDGRVKYGVPEGADADRAGEVLWAEKLREDRLRRRVRVARWVWSVASAAPALGRVLAEVGIRSQPRSTWFDLGA
ncbi:hypothetical protein [Phycicoccus avicenniae]|uniref:hypothetical protein n=1 Tax=Phycicoccus avicenniae TaxID=2828860 RepID=UPI003D2C9BC4